MRRKRFAKAPLRFLAAAALVCSAAACSPSAEKAAPADSRPEPFEPEPWYTLSGMFPNREIVEPKPDIHPKQLEQLNELLARGRYLTTSAAACGSCHGADPADPGSPLSGGRRLIDNNGVVRAPNITPDRKTGVGGWKPSEIMRAIRASIGRDGRALSVEVHDGFRWMSDEDARAIAGFILSRPAVRSPVERRELGLFARKRLGIIERRRPVKGYVPALADTQAVPEYGRYLSHHVSGCKRCHTARDGFVYDGAPFAGSRAQDKRSRAKSLKEFAGLAAKRKSELGAAPQTAPLPIPPGAPDIRGGEGLAGWDLEQIERYLKTGTTPSGDVADAELCPWPYYRGMSNKDKRAIARYLKTL